MKCPCENCLCVPICRHKQHYKLLEDCHLINKYVKTSNNKDHVLEIIQKIIEPQLWRVSGPTTMTIKAPGEI